MQAVLKLCGLGALAGTLISAANAEEMSVSVELPSLNVAEYHRPYVAIWIARPDHSVAANLAVWYQQESGPEGEGETWLKDIRQWWRRTGRELDMPVDGVSSPTRAPGEHLLFFSGNESPLADLPVGEYVLHVEASREVGGRELLKLPFNWNGEPSETVTLEGETELGTVSLTILP